ncbi:MAG TPA: class I SAM-dependent methyltransferase, partial [Thermoguttaceae bacterium]|nr:class I SAM-dependent methyltransferase [Thermoguttaceae bacterium]
MLSRNRPSGSHILPLLVICCQACLICPGAEASDAHPRDLAGRILADTGVQGGLIVHLGCGDGQLTAALCAGDGYLVHGLDSDADQVAKARAHLQSLGAYGTASLAAGGTASFAAGGTASFAAGGTVSVDRFDGRHLPYIDNLVSLIVVEDRYDVPTEEVMRVL